MLNPLRAGPRVFTQTYFNGKLHYLYTVKIIVYVYKLDAEPLMFNSSYFETT